MKNKFSQIESNQDSLTFESEMYCKTKAKAKLLTDTLTAEQLALYQELMLTYSEYMDAKFEVKLMNARYEI